MDVKQDTLEAWRAVYSFLVVQGYTDEIKQPRSTCNCAQCVGKRSAGIKNERDTHGGQS